MKKVSKDVDDTLSKLFIYKYGIMIIRISKKIRTYKPKCTFTYIQTESSRIALQKFLCLFINM